MPEKLSQDAKDAALRSFDERREDHPEHIDQGTLPAGSPMTFYCRLCGWISDIMPEDYFLGTPRKVCTECAGLVEQGLVDDPSSEWGSGYAWTERLAREPDDGRTRRTSG